MTRQEIMGYVAERFGIEPNEGGVYDINDYDWQSGCFHNGRWLCLAEIVKTVETIAEDYGIE